MPQDSTLLNVFLTVVNERSFTRAAEKLYRTQPAVSLAIQRLEAELGETLIDRSGRDLALTDTGRLVYECARQQENLHRGLMNQIAETRNKSIGRLCIGANESMTLYLLPHLCEFRRAYPRVKVVVQRSRSGEIPDRLLAGDMDLGVVSYGMDDERFRSQPLYVDHLSFVVPPGHRLANRSSVSVKDLEMEVFIAHNVASPYRDAVIRAFHDAKAALNMDIEMPTVESIRRMVQAGQGVAFLPRMCVDQDVRQGVLKELKVKELRLERKIHLVSVEKRPLSHAARAFLELVSRGQGWQAGDTA
ncbi:MAG TPA: LysR family transcriptional regulator [Holophagaceae bacterium]|jgi:DNA-binding transcriptional LysR family regulator|nr:LysR family transcriptional regulator [Holophagaceae bacterium]